MLNCIHISIETKLNTLVLVTYSLATTSLQQLANLSKKKLLFTIQISFLHCLML